MAYTTFFYSNPIFPLIFWVVICWFGVFFFPSWYFSLPLSCTPLSLGLFYFMTDSSKVSPTNKNTEFNWSVASMGNYYIGEKKNKKAGIGTEWWTLSMDKLSQDKTIISAWLGLEAWLHICTLFPPSSNCSDMHTENQCFICGMHLHTLTTVSASPKNRSTHLVQEGLAALPLMAARQAQQQDAICQINQINSSLHNWQFKKASSPEKYGKSHKSYLRNTHQDPPQSVWAIRALNPLNPSHAITYFVFPWGGKKINTFLQGFF